MKPSRIPLFPLDVVLLPSMALPLHIFEPRYEIMIGHCMAESTEFGVIRAADGGIARTGCTAEVAQKLKDYPDGRFDIMTEGRRVFHLIELLEEKEYYEAMVEFLVEGTVPGDPRTEPHLIQLFQKAHMALAGQEWVVANTDADIPLTYRMASLLPIELAEKQELLEMRSEASRQDFLLRWLTAFLANFERRSRIQRRASGNGHGLN
jgi:Lon protease-like protein